MGCVRCEDTARGAYSDQGPFLSGYLKTLRCGKGARSRNGGGGKALPHNHNHSQGRYGVLYLQGGRDQMKRTCAK